MSDGMSDARAEGEIYRKVWEAIYDVRQHATEDDRGLAGRWPRQLVERMNELLTGAGWRFAPAMYAELPNEFEISEARAVALWTAITNLRDALRQHKAGHRGWTPCIDSTLDGLLHGTGCELVEHRQEQWETL